MDELEQETVFAGKVSYQGLGRGSTSTIWKRLGRQENYNKNNKADNNGRQSNEKNGRQASSANTQKKCGRCGMIHEFKCPALGVICHYCNKPDHFARMCKKLEYKRLNYAQNLQLDSDDDEDPEDLFVGAVKIKNFRGKPQWTN